MFLAIVATLALIGYATRVPLWREFGQTNFWGALIPAGISLVSGLLGSKQSSNDSKKARSLSDAAVQSSQQGARGAVQQYGLNAPLRDAFRFGALNLGGSPAFATNPFSTNLFGGFTDFLQRETGPQGVGTGFEALAPQRPDPVSGLLQGTMFAGLGNQLADQINAKQDQRYQDAMAQYQRQNPLQVGASRFQSMM